MMLEDLKGKTITAVNEVKENGNVAKIIIGFSDGSELTVEKISFPDVNPVSFIDKVDFCLNGKKITSIDI